MENTFDRKTYMRNYMRERRAALKQSEMLGAETAQDIDLSEDGSDTDGTGLPTWVVLSILGGIGVLFVGLIVFTIVSDRRKTVADKPDSEETTQGEYSSVNLPLGHTVPIPNVGQYGC